MISESVKLFLSALTVFTIIAIIIIAFAHVTQIKVTFVGLTFVTAILAFRMAYDVLKKG